MKELQSVSLSDAKVPLNWVKEIGERSQSSKYSIINPHFYVNRQFAAWLFAVSFFTNCLIKISELLKEIAETIQVLNNSFSAIYQETSKTTHKPNE